ncbi:hypothetical protein BDW22DRAFT_1332221 [Trametopsis cervina]|nr:hypothetical protein BDW22DRAFT_1332221 [Trametopsis cervina]
MRKTIALTLQPALRSRSRCYSTLPASSSTTASTDAPAPNTATDATAAGEGAETAKTRAVKYPYFVPRNSQGSIPVYTDYRNHNKVVTLIRNVEGNLDALISELKTTLAEPGSPEAARLKLSAAHGRHITLAGGDWKRPVVRFLTAKGF